MTLLLDGLIASLVLFLIIVLILQIPKMKIYMKKIHSFISSLIPFMKGVASLQKIKQFWVMIFCIMILSASLYVPYHLKNSQYEKFIGYGIIFNHSVKSRFASDDPKKLIQEINLQDHMSIDYGTIAIEFIGIAAFCGTGYTFSNMIYKNK